MGEEFKILVDENLSRKILLSLPSFPGSLHVSSCYLERTSDVEIWEFAEKNGYAILTRDIDFYSLSTLRGCPPKVIHLVTPKANQSTQYFRDRLSRSIPAITDFLKSDLHCYLELE
jgi:predicted nuclease of predicted toxin-antitoxin system